MFAETLGVIGCFERLKVPYMLGGSLAMGFYGVLRATRDADLIAELQRADAQRVASDLAGDYYVDVEAAEDAIARKLSFNIIHIPRAFKIDVFPLPARAYDRQALSRRVNMPVEGAAVSVFVQSPEDVVLAKLRWYRLGGEKSDQQWRDILGIVKLQQSRLDTAYLNHWAREEAVRDLLDRAMGEV